MTRVLLVEDHFPDALLLMEWLEIVGASWEVVHVETFAEAALSWEAEAFDALLLDLDIPDGFGLDLLTRALALVGDRPLVVLSGLADGERAAQALEVGAWAYVVKGQAAVQELLVLLEGAQGLERS
ncbi:Response regulatory domain-containing protein [Deinococcus saxicola]|uniref:response regulator n=1 Tax=Deinococcus saxicola TaxID=249406 RepID=UPI0039EFF844